MNGNWYDIGNEIRGAVQESIRNGDFSNLGNVISDTVNGVVDEAKRQVQQSMGQAQQPKHHTRQSEHRKQQTVYGKQQTVYRTRQTQTPDTYYSARTSSRIFRRKGDVSSVLFTVFGGIGTGITAVGLLVFALIAVALLKPVTGIIGSALIAALMCGSIGMLAKGASNRNRLARAERYLSIARNRGYVNIADLARQTGKREEFVRKDVKKMMAAGMFPQGHLDRQESCLMLSDETYSEYLDLERQRLALESETSSKAKPATSSGDTFLESEEKRVWRSLSGIEDPGDELKRDNPALASMICQGQECTGHIRQMNDRIQGEVISEKLFALENVLKEIFKRVREHPKQMEKMQKFMNYYLPTTLKLVEAYEEFDRVPNPNEEIVQAKLELEKTLDTINQSFQELLNQMYQESVFDATTDAKVLQTMLAKDGLAKDHAFEIE